MNRFQSSISVVVAGGMLASLLVACSETNRNTAPVELIATATVTKPVIDVAAPPAASAVATINVRALQKSNDSTVPSDTRFLDVRIQSYRVSYVRTDGGHTVPAPFVISSGQLITAGGTDAVLSNFIVFQPEAFNAAPFAALLPNNGGVDPETGRRRVDLDVVVEVFGETLSGQNVYATTRFPLQFCYGCS